VTQHIAFIDLAAQRWRIVLEIDAAIASVLAMAFHFGARSRRLAGC
jgi:hypothetical protein